MLSYPTDQFCSLALHPLSVVRCPLVPLSTVGFICRLCRTYFSHSIVGLSLFCATCIFHLSSGNGNLSHCLGAKAGACPLRLYAWLIVALSCAQFGVWAQVLLKYRSHYVRQFRYSAVLYWNLFFVFPSTLILDINGPGAGTDTRAPLREIACVVIMIWVHCCRNSLSSTQRCCQTFQLNGLTIVFDC